LAQTLFHASVLYHASSQRILNSKGRTKNGHPRDKPGSSLSNTAGLWTASLGQEVKGDACVNLHVGSTTSLQSRYQVLSDVTSHIFIRTAALY